MRHSRSFNDMNYNEFNQNPTQMQMDGMHGERDMNLPAVKGFYRKRMPDMFNGDEDSDSNESMSDVYIRRLNKYQFKIEDLSYKYSKNLKKLNDRFNYKKTTYNKPFVGMEPVGYGPG